MRRTWATMGSGLAGTVLIGLAFGAAPATADARRGTVDLTVDLSSGVPSCIEGPVLRERVERELDREGLIEPIAIAVTVDGAEDEGWRVRIGLAAADGGLGYRDLIIGEPDCAAIADAVALVVVLALRGPMERGAPMAVEDLPAAAGAALGRPNPTAEPTHTSPTTRPTTVTDQTARWSWGLALGGGLRAGSLPGASPLGALSVELLSPSEWRLLLTGALTLPERIAVDEGQVRLLHVDVRLALCRPLLSTGNTGIDACGVVAAGLLDARASGYAGWNGASTEPTVDVGAGARLRQGLGAGLHLFVAAEAGGDVDGDGRSEVLVAAGTNAIGDEDAGAVWLVYGAGRFDRYARCHYDLADPESHDTCGPVGGGVSGEALGSGIMGCLCTIRCVTDVECPRPSTGTATPVCDDTGSCRLPCASGATCPDGMSCAPGMDSCLWPSP